LTNKYDTIIIGSGLGGLLCGVILSRKGQKVLILEKNHQIGGSLQSFRRMKCDFSTGLHYVGSLDKGQTLHKLFKYFKLFDGIKYHRLDETGFDIFNIGGKEYKFPFGLDNFKAKMCEYFPEESEAIETYMTEIHRTINSQDIYLLKKHDKKIENMNKYLTLNTWDFIQSITDNSRLQQVLSALNFVYAGEKAKSPLYIHALVNNHFISSSYRIVGSTSQVANKLAEQIMEKGGTIIKNNGVSNLVIENDTVTAVETSDGSIFHADNIISNVHPATTMDFIGRDSIKNSFRARMKRKENTISAFAVHIIMKDKTFKYRNHNYNYYKGEEVWYASHYDSSKWPEHYYMHCSVPNDGSEYTNSLGLLTHMLYEEVEQWAELPMNRRGDDYNEFKTKKAEQLIDLATIQFPELKDNIAGFSVSTPLTYKDYLGSPKGSMYGTMRDCNNPVGSYISPRTKINNLYFTGQNINLHGILGVSLSAILTCGEFVGTNSILKEINDENQ